MIWAFWRYYFSRSLKHWRSLRRECMAALPKQEKAGDVEQ